MKRITLDYYKKGQFEFLVEEYSDIYIEGKFIDFEEKITEIEAIDELIEAEDECWYLDDDGYRLEDKALFEKSPWSIIENNNAKKIVQRFMDYKNGETTFCLEPWFRIGDEFNYNPKLNKNNNE